MVGGFLEKNLHPSRATTTLAVALLDLLDTDHAGHVPFVAHGSSFVCDKQSAGYIRTDDDGSRALHGLSRKRKGEQRGPSEAQQFGRASLLSLLTYGRGSMVW